MSESKIQSGGSMWNRGLPIGFTIILAASFTGYFVGLRESRNTNEAQDVTWTQPKGHSETSEPDSSVPKVVKYADLAKTNLGANQTWHSSVNALNVPMVSPPKNPAPLEQVIAALKQRQETRAFSGAPPGIPHPITQLSSTSCLVCHEKGVLVNGKVAHKMSHPFYASCTQCHVDVSGTTSATFTVNNTFVDVNPETKGQRAFPGAPPVIPHALFMRQDCLSCHGPTGMAALKTTHPQQRSCFQCHVPSNPFDQPAFFTQIHKTKP